MDVIGKIITKDYSLTIENIEGNAFCHIDVFNWNASVYKTMILDLEKIKEAVGVVLWCAIDKFHKHQIKLANMFGFFTEYESPSIFFMRLM